MMLPCTLIFAACALATASSSTDLLNVSKIPGLPKMMQEPAIHQPEVYHHAMQIITSMETSPSCNRLATATLIDSCRSLEYGHLGDTNLYTSLDQVKSVFAARLAVCELNGAHAVVPHPCIPMLPARSTESRGFKCRIPGYHCHSEKDSEQFHYEKMSDEQTKQCLVTMESRPQWWTSYSNARQNAVVVCHAARGETEKDELLKLHKMMNGAASGMSRALEKSVEQARLAQKEKEQFLEAVRLLQFKVLEDMELIQRKHGEGWTSFMQSTYESVKVLVGMVSSDTRKAAKEVEELSTSIQDTTQEAKKLKSAVTDTLDSVGKQHKSLADAQHDHLKRQEDKALAVQSSMNTLQEKQMKELTITFQMIQTELTASGQLLQHMHQRQDALDQRLLSITEEFQGLQKTALQLAEAQAQQGLTQSHLFSFMQAQLHQTTAALENFQAKVDSLSDTVAEKTSQVNELDLTAILAKQVEALGMWAIYPVLAILAGLLLRMLSRELFILYLIVMLLLFSVWFGAPVKLLTLQMNRLNFRSTTQNDGHPGIHDYYATAEYLGLGVIVFSLLGGALYGLVVRSRMQDQRSLPYLLLRVREANPAAPP